MAVALRCVAGVQESRRAQRAGSLKSTESGPFRFTSRFSLALFVLLASSVGLNNNEWFLCDQDYLYSYNGYANLHLFRTGWTLGGTPLCFLCASCIPTDLVINPS